MKLDFDNIKLTASIEDYLEAINILSAREKVVRVKDIAAFLDVKMPSVNSALKILADKGLINHEAYGHVELTEKGLEYAREIYRRHKLISQFFQEVLGVPYKIADDDACKVEHVLSLETLDKLAAFMAVMEKQIEEQPDWFVDFKDKIRAQKVSSRSMDYIKAGLVNLTKSREGKKFLVKKIDGGKVLKQRLATLGLLPETICEILTNNDGQVILEIKGATIALGGGMASKIWGKPK